MYIERGSALYKMSSSKAHELVVIGARVAAGLANLPPPMLAHLLRSDGSWTDARVERDGDTVLLHPVDGGPGVEADGPLLLVNDLQDDGAEDMTTLSHLHEPALLHNLQHRLSRHRIYTHVGHICIAVNPFSWEVSAPHYTEAVQESYRRAAGAQLPPHLFALAERTHEAVRRADGDQSVLVSGESGAGKTEAVKLLMRYLSHEGSEAAADGRRAEASGAEAHTASIAERVLATNPLLEAFGNAATLRNANSSRFGKFIALQFGGGGRLRGASIHVYLLEKSRVVRRMAGERSYHVLYQCLHGRAATEIDDPVGYAYASTFAYLRDAGGPTPVSAVDADPQRCVDGGALSRTAEAMSAVGLSPEEIRGVWRTLSAVLLLGELAVEIAAGASADAEAAANAAAVAAAGGSAVVGTERGAAQGTAEDGRCTVASSSAAALARVSELLGVAEPEDLNGALCMRRLLTREEEVMVQLTPEQACDSRDALAKALYGRIFAWLVGRCNETIAAPAAVGATVGVLDIFGFDRLRSSSIGILDIFGFESFATNSFEQLCINYANEALQGQFCADVFRAEQLEYEREGIPWQRVPYEDNSATLALLTCEVGKGLSILQLLDEESFIQAGTDENFVSKLHGIHPSADGGTGAAHPLLAFPRTSRTRFTVHHYAGDVTYEAVGMRDKNRDVLHPDLAGLMARESGEPFVRALFAELAPVPESPGGAAPPNGDGRWGNGPPPLARRGSGRRKAEARRSAGSQFVAQLAELMAALGRTTTHYVRCIKPNPAAAPLGFDGVYVASQLRAAGVLEAVHIARKAFPTRMPIHTFLERFAILAAAPGRGCGGASASVPTDAAEHETKLEDETSGDPTARRRAACSALLGVLLQRHPAAAAAAATAAALHDASPVAAVAADAADAPDQAVAGTQPRYVLGRSKIFFRSTVLEDLERRRTAVQDRHVTVLQTAARRRAAVVSYRATRASAISLQALRRGAASRRSFGRQRAAAVSLQLHQRARRARLVVRRAAAARALQAHARMAEARRTLAQLRAAVLEVQRRRRGTVARQKVAAARLEEARVQDVEWQLSELRRRLQEESGSSAELLAAQQRSYEVSSIQREPSRLTRALPEPYPSPARALPEPCPSPTHGALITFRQAANRQRIACGSLSRSPRWPSCARRPRRCATSSVSPRESARVSSPMRRQRACRHGWRSQRSRRPSRQRRRSCRLLSRRACCRRYRRRHRPCPTRSCPPHHHCHRHLWTRWRRHRCGSALGPARARARRSHQRSQRSVPNAHHRSYCACFTSRSASAISCAASATCTPTRRAGTRAPR